MLKFQSFLLALLLGITLPASAAQRDELPDIGSSSAAVLSQDKAFQIGRMVVRGLRDSGRLMDDPEVNQYVSSIGHRIATHGQSEGQHFEFLVVGDPSINAFALPGGFIGVNAGLLLASNNESELAGVLAHEIAHVTQKHIARQVEAAGRINLMSAAAVLAAILVGTQSSSSDTTVAGVMAAQSAGIQQQINFTRSNEYEADRIGMGFLVAAGFDPTGMPSFFETLSRQTLTASAVPELLRTHPVTSNRIAESRDRALQFERREVADSLSYTLARARLRVLTAPTPEQALTYFRSSVSDFSKASDDVRYGIGLALLEGSRPTEAEPVFRALLTENDDVIEYHIATGQAQMASGDTEPALRTFADALALFPRNIPLTMRYSQALLQAGRPAKAHSLMLDLLNNVAYTPPQLRLLALAANAAGDTADAHYYMAEFHVLNGELRLAIDQLEMALATPKIAEYQRARYASRRDLIKEHLPKKERRQLERESG